MITLLADPENTGGLLTSNRSLMRAGSEGAPPHYHRRSAELFFVLNGRLTVLLDEDVVTLKPEFRSWWAYEGCFRGVSPAFTGFRDPRTSKSVGTRFAL